MRLVLILRQIILLFVLIKDIFRPTEVETLLGDSSKAKDQLNWQPKISFQELVSEMMSADLQEAKKDKLCEEKGFSIFNHHE